MIVELVIAYWQPIVIVAGVPTSIFTGITITQLVMWFGIGGK